MLKKFVEIKNIGKFVDFHAHGDIEFRKINLIYGDNGQGKTTLAAILRSLTTNNPLWLLERKTVNSTSSIQVKVLSDTHSSTFSETTSWDNPLSGIEIFDSTFVNRNIFSGNFLLHDHKKNLYYFVIGEQGIQLAREIEQLDIDLRTNLKSISDLKSSIQEHDGVSGSIDGFIKLTKEDKVDEKISQATTKLRLIENSEALIKRSMLNIVEEILFPDTFEKQILKTLDTISKDAERKTKEHIKSCLGDHGEEWIEEGIGYLSQSENCPFCGQQHNQNELISAYQDYFSELYSKHKSEIKNLSDQINESFSERKLLEFQRVIEENHQLISQWNEDLTLPDEKYSFDQIHEEWEKAKISVTGLVNRKISKLIVTVSNIS